NDQLRLGGHSERTAYYLSLNANRSDFGLATPTAEVLHDDARGLGAFASVVHKLDGDDDLRLVTGVRGDRYEVPNGPLAEAAGVHDVEQEREALVTVSWVRSTGGSLLTVSPFYHSNRADFLGGGHQPIVPTDKHRSEYAGAQVAFSRLTETHRLKAGLHAFYQWDHAFFGLRATDESGRSLEQESALTGHLEAVFVEDQWKPTPRLTLTGGVRYTHFQGSLTENEWSPRLGAAFRIPRLEWVARGFWGRYYQAPPLQTVSGPVVDFALEQGFG